jgi:hypothetical protein
MSKQPIFCSQCNQPLDQFGKFPTCTQHGQVFPEKAFAPLRIFLSYGHDDNEELVRRIKTDLEKRGHDVWFDKSEIKSGDDWRRAITEGIVSSDCVLSFLSKYSTREPGVCLSEIGIAMKVKGGNIQTILVEREDEVKPPPSISHIQWLDMHDWKEQPLEQKWYQDKLAELVAVVESNESRCFAGEIKTLEGYLKPIFSDSRIQRLLEKNFVGRTELEGAIEQWRNTADRDSRLFWIMAAPGAGKSAFAAHLAHYHPEKVIAVHFCEYDKPDHRSADRIVRTLAFQIATRLPDYRNLLLNLPEIHQLDPKNSAELFDYLLGNPLRNAIDGARERYLIVIDALDEAVADGRNELVEMLALNAPRLPDWIAIVLTSRPEFDITTSLQGLKPYLLDTQTESNRIDIRNYLRRELASQLRNREDNGRCVEQIVEKSEGVFLYVEHFCLEVQHGHLSLDRPQQFPQGLGGIFLQYFQRRFSNLEKFSKEVRPMLAVILAAREPLKVEILQRLFNLQDEERRDFTRSLGSLFPVTTEGNKVIKPYHKALADWLADEAKAGPYFVHVTEGHRMLADNYLKRWGGIDTGLQLLCEEVAGTVGSESYGIRHVCEHLALGGYIDQLHKLLSLDSGRQQSSRTGWISRIALRATGDQHSAPLESENTWFKIHEMNGVVGSYLKDVAIGSLAAQAANNALPTEGRYALMRASVIGLNQNIPPALIAELVRHNLWSLEAGMAVALELMSIPSHPLEPKRLGDEAFLRLLVFMLEGKLKEGYQWLLKESEAILVRALTWLFKGPNQDFAVTLLSRLRRALPESRFEELCNSVVATSEQPVGFVPSAFLLESADLFSHRQLIRLSKTVMGSGLGILPRQLDPVEVTKLLAERLAVARARSFGPYDEWMSTAAFVAYAPDRREASHVATEFLKKENSAEFVFNLIPEDLVCHFVKALSVEQVVKIVDRTCRISAKAVRIEMLSKLAPCLPERLHTLVVRKLCDDIRWRWRRSRLSNYNAAQVCEVITGVDHRLAQTVSWRALRPLRKGRRHNSEEMMVIARLIQQLPLAEQERHVSLAISAAADCDGPTERALAFAGIAPLLNTRNRLEYAVHRVRRLKDEEAAARARLMLAKGLPLKEVRRMVRSAKTLTGSGRNWTANAHSLLTAEVRADESALSRVKKILAKDEGAWAWLFFVEPSLLRELSSSARDELLLTVLDPNRWKVPREHFRPNWGEGLPRIAPWLRGPSRAMSVTLARDHLTAGERAKFFAELLISAKAYDRQQLTTELFDLPSRLESSVTALELTEHLINSIPDWETRAVACAAIAASVPDTSAVLLEKALAIARSPEGPEFNTNSDVIVYTTYPIWRRGPNQIRALARIAREVGEPYRTLTLREAMDIASNETVGWRKAEGLVKIAGVADGLLREQALTAMFSSMDHATHLERMELLSEAVPIILNMGDELALTFFRITLEKFRRSGRRELLEVVGTLRPIFMRIGGKAAVCEMDSAIDLVRDWWP